MKHKLHKLLSVLMAMAMLVSLMPAAVFAADTAESVEDSIIVTVDEASDAAEASTEVTEPAADTVEPSTEVTEPTTEPATAPTESAVICTCESDDPSWHAPFCDLYTAPENPECFCVEKCGEGWVNEWCEVCYFDPGACWASGEEEAAVYPSTPTYIASLGIAQDADKGDAINELSGHTVIDYDLNKGCGSSSDYIYMGYKTTTDPSQAITGIFIRTGENPPASATFDGVTAYLVGGSYEANTAVDNVVDLNEDAGGSYIYVYVTRDTSRAPVTEITFSSSSSKSGYTTPNVDLNQGVGGSDDIYLHYKQFSATVSSTYYYLTSSGSRTSSSESATVKHHLETMAKVPSYSTSVTYDGRTFTFKGWREDNTAGAATVTSPSATYITGNKTYRAVYAADVKLSYDANGGSGAPAAQKATQYINAGSSSVAKQSVSFTIPDSTYTHSTKCFMGWSADKTAATAAYQPGGKNTISSNTTLYAVYADHSYTSGVCTTCGEPKPDSVAVLTKNGRNVLAGTTLDTVIAQAENCTAADKAVVIILQNIDLGGNYQSIDSGVFTIDLNGFEIKGISSGAVLHLNLSSTNVTLQDSGETGKITGESAGIYVGNGATLTISSGTISATDSTYGRAVLIRYKPTVNINGGTISGEQYGVCAYSASSSGGRATLNISGGTIIGGKSGVMLMTNPTALNISGGTISGEENGVLAEVSNCTVNISSGTISGERFNSVYFFPSLSGSLNISGGFFNGKIGSNDSDTKLTVGEDGVGATFLGGITAKLRTDCDLNTVLAEGAAYWAGDTMLAVAEGATEITGLGDITIKAACTHESGTRQGYANRGNNHTYRWSCCKLEVTENHTFTDTKCVCGALNHTCQYTNGFCIEGCYEPAQLKDGYYQITNGGNLFWFAEYINTVDRTANAKLTADINLENRPWTPIGSTGESSNNFRGTFDGQNYTITGLYVEGDRAGLGFFGEVRTGTVKNFTIYGEVVVNTDVDYVGGVIGSICGVNGENDLERNGAIIQNITSFVNVTAKAHGIGMIGGFVGYANHQSLIENCSWYGTFDAGIYRVDSGAGGFIGKIQENTSEVTIRNCGAYGTIKTNYAKNSYNNTPTIYMGGFLSFSNTNALTTLENCLFAGKFECGANLTDEARLGAFGTLRSVNAIKNCYYLGDDGLAAVHSDSNLNPNSENVEITTVTAEQLKSGEIAYKLQTANEIWGQNIGTDAYPVLGGAKVYSVDTCKGTFAGYSNTEGPAHDYVDGTCINCGIDDPSIPKYTLTVSEADNGTVTAEKPSYAEGKAVTLTISPAEGYALESLTVDGTDVTAQVQNGTYTFTMPAKAVTVTAVFAQIVYYDLWIGGEQVASNNLTISGSSGTAVYDPAANTLTLNGYTYADGYQADSSHYSAAIYCGTDSLQLVLNGESTVVRKDTVYNLLNCGIYAKGDIEILDGDAEGIGSLTVTAGMCEGHYNKSYGVYVADTLTVNGGTLTANGGKTDNSCGVEANSVTILGGSLTGVGGEADSSYGVYTDDTITVNGGSLTGIGDKNGDGNGVVAGAAIKVDGGSLTGIGGNDSYSYGVYTISSITVNSGTLKASCGTAENSYGVGISYGLTLGSGISMLTPVGGRADNDKNAIVDAEGNIATTVEIGTCTGHSFSNGKCAVCGKELFYGTNMTLGNELDLNFALETDIVPDGAYAIITRSYADNTSVTATIEKAKWTEQGSLSLITYEGLAAKEMCDKVSVTVYDKDDKALGTREDSIRSYAMRCIKDDKDKYSKEVKVLLIKMLDYGAEAQNEFKHNTGDLANKEITGQMRTDYPFEKQTVVNSGSAVAGQYMGTSLILKTRIEMQMGFYGDPTDVTATVSYTDHYGTQKTFSGTEVKIATYTDTETKKPVAYGVIIPNIVVGDARQEVTVTVTPAEGETITVKDSIASYAARHDSAGVYGAIMNFSDAALAYFKTQTN